MLDDLLGRGFASKVKSLMKVTKTRIEAVRKKRNATHKFLKKDIADLLANGLDINAFGRAEGLVSELIVLSCYDFVEHCCECVLKNLSLMQKKRECSEDCKVAVASLMFAAARFSDLPELRDLRQIFQGRYGNSLERYINQKFVKNLSAKPVSMESKLQLMQDIAFQYSIVWNAKAFEHRMSISSVSTQKEHLDNGSFCGADNGINTASSYKSELGNCINKVNCTSLRGLFDKPDQDSKENANTRNEARNDKFFEDILSSDVHKTPNHKEDVSVRAVDSVLPLSRGKNVTEILKPNNSKSSSRRGIEVSDAHESHSHSKCRGIEVSIMLDSHIAKEPFPRGSKNLEAQNCQEVVTSDKIKSGSLSQENKLNFAIGGFKPLEITEKATPQKLLHRKPETCSTGKQSSSETDNRYIGSLASSEQKQQNILIKGQVQAGQVQAGHEANIKLFHPPPYVKPSKVVQEVLPSESKDAKNHEDFVTPHVSAVDHIRLKPGSSHDGTGGPFDYPEHAKSTNGHVKPPKASRHVAISESAHPGLSQKGMGRHFDPINHTMSKSGQITRHAWSQFEHHESETQVSEQGRTMSRHPREASSDHDDIARLILPMPRSTRRRSTRSSSHESSHIEGRGKCDEKKTVSRTSNRRRRRESRRIKQHTLVDMDIPMKDEDKILDNLLIHYSSKPSSIDTVEAGVKKVGEMQITTPFPPRSVSLPREQSVPLQPTKVFTRAATFHLDRATQHVHPKLPDYDDLAARFSAMKAKF